MEKLANGRSHLAEEAEVVEWIYVEVVVEHTKGVATRDVGAVEAAAHGIQIASEEPDDAIRCGKWTGGSDLHHRSLALPEPAANRC